MAGIGYELMTRIGDVTDELKRHVKDRFEPYEGVYRLNDSADYVSEADWEPRLGGPPVVVAEGVAAHRQRPVRCRRRRHDGRGDRGRLRRSDVRAGVCLLHRGRRGRITVDEAPAQPRAGQGLNLLMCKPFMN